MPDSARRAHAGILRPATAAHHLDLRQSTPPTGLTPLVDHLWCVTWRAPEGHVQGVIPRPAVQVVAERIDGTPQLLAHGVMTTRFERHLLGTGRAVGAAFAPAGFRPVLGRSVSGLRDRAVPLAELLDEASDVALAEALLDPALDADAAMALLAERLLACRRTRDPRSATLAALVEQVEADTSIRRAEQLADLAGVSLRTLQRQFTEHVGIGPKWVVQRCRLLDVAAAAHDAGPVDWSALADDLGYADQSHLIRAFTRLIGRPPAAYVMSDAGPGDAGPGPAGPIVTR